jgi:hypothetical protein|nr:MAG TPA: structural protein [Caudoviricetes sp.]
MSNNYIKLVNSVARTKARVIQQSKQRRGGVTDLYALDYVSTFSTSKSCAPYGDADDDEKESKDVQGRIKQFVKAIKKEIPEAKVEGVSAIIGYFGIESNVTAKRYETDYLTDYAFDKMKEEPTAENLVGSWGAFQAMYPNQELYEPGYNVDGKHWIGVGLGQWTGVRCKALFDFAKKDGRRNIFTFGTQFKFMLSEEGLNNVVKEVASSSNSIDDLTARFLKDWGGVPGNKLADRIAFANKHKDFIKSVLDGVDSSKEEDKKNPEDTVPINKNSKSASFRVLVPSDLDRFQRWFLKFIVEQDKSACEGGKVNPLTDVHLVVSAKNERTGDTSEIELTEIFRRQWGCNWIGDDSSGEGIFPNNKPLEGYDLMYSAWYLNNAQRDALFSAGEKIFTVYALGEAKITLRNFLKYSHIN